jgi:hypothetical protein
MHPKVLYQARFSFQFGSCLGVKISHRVYFPEIRYLSKIDIANSGCAPYPDFHLKILERGPKMQVQVSRWLSVAMFAAAVSFAGFAQAAPNTMTYVGGPPAQSVAINHLLAGGLRDPVVSYTASPSAPGFTDVVLAADGSYVSDYVAGQSPPGLLGDLNVANYNLSYTHFNVAGKGYNSKYLAWSNASYNAANPIQVQFNISSPLTVSWLKEVAVWFDNEPGKNVYAPSQIIVDGTSYDVGSVANGPAMFDIMGLNLHGSTYTVGFVPGSSTGYTMVNDVQFFRAFSATPEPTSWAMMLIGVGSVGAMLRSRRRLVAA